MTSDKKTGSFRTISAASCVLAALLVRDGGLVKQILHVIVEYPGSQPVEAAVELEPFPIRLKAFEIRTVRLAK